jgi:DNA mismatch endonuclease, patch repair protein
VPLTRSAGDALRAPWNLSNGPAVWQLGRSRLDGVRRNLTDRLTPERRSALMSRIRGKDTSPELAVRRSLRQLGIRYRSYRRLAGATVDLVLPDRRTVLLVHGCFWHGCARHPRSSKSRVAYWSSKIAANRERDRLQTAALKAAGWKVLVIWEHDLKRDLPRRVGRIVSGKPVPRTDSARPSGLEQPTL